MSGELDALHASIAHKFMEALRKSTKEFVDEHQKEDGISEVRWTLIKKKGTLYW